ncbi:NAD(P)H-hydrate dehydratase [Pontibacter sp. SGAir0037]|uniref:NAD(P)H-hydrate dehydratase n=1 Tax=Pontibacter sp. SGAir0037 TaxID=2571030 RepID=UPI0010CCB319|nr:NAD(P)H-hydrate dehydratase [Pontibacter sp. SGAir0037]QCR24200.1 bifunctional ADP-dependent NAD(P)H-hydrate dehydratase/NAD(P)H-hydrate epimerase [Pontibacter sp. SGAir0037]
MKILSAAQTREADAYTINQENISSVELMERAARAFTGWFENKFPAPQTVYIFCGPGNNGGDGLAVARLLCERLYKAKVYVVGDSAKASPDFKKNFDRLPDEVDYLHISSSEAIPDLPSGACVIDALFGTGLNRPVTDLFAHVIKRLNNSRACITSIDMPSGLYTDSQTPAEGAIVKAAYTISFELPKLSFFLPQHESYIGDWHVVPIGLSADFISSVDTDKYYTTATDAQRLLKPRKKFSHKGLYGHALLLGGAMGKMGAAVLAARACLRSGVGLLTVQTPAVGYSIIQTAVPEAMTLVDKNRKYLTALDESIEKYNAIGIGPGIGTEKVTKTLIGQLLATTQAPLVIDADAINLIASSDRLKSQLPKNKVIFTPHPKEFERLVGKTKDNYDRLEHLREFCQEYACYVVLKGNHTAIGTPEGKIYFNTTGNAGMATGGTGDVLTGVLTALVAQQYTLEEACVLGVYLHGLAGDLAKSQVGDVSMIASDLIDYLPQAFRQMVQV